MPTREEILVIADENAIVEFYSKSSGDLPNQNYEKTKDEQEKVLQET